MGPAWHRYNDDGYGEHADGSPFDGTGIGRAWPLITGERAHYELAAGPWRRRGGCAVRLESFTGEGGMLPEQVWDATGHSEPGTVLWKAVRLRHAARVGPRRVLEAASVPGGRKGLRHPSPDGEAIRGGGPAFPLCPLAAESEKPRHPSGEDPRAIELPQEEIVKWRVDGGGAGKAASRAAGSGEVPTRSTGLGVHVADLPTSDMSSGTRVAFTVLGSEFSVTVGSE